MGKVLFYHLTQAPLEAVLPMLLDKSRAAGWRVLVRGRDAARLDWLDQRLWLGAEEGFLPHGVEGGDHDADQPILLSLGGPGANGAACLMSVDGADVEAAEIGALERVCILFDGNDPAALDHARGQWKALTGAGCLAEYWAQEDGRWTKKAEAGGGAD